MPRNGASAPFADPRLTSAQAHPVWLPGIRADRLHFTVDPFGEEDRDRPGISVSALPNVEHILFDASGRQHVVVRSGTTLTQFTVGGREALIGPVAFGLDLRRCEEFGLVGKVLAALGRALRRSPNVRGETPSWSGQPLNLRDSLIALDCERAGAKLREIAIVIHGRARIEREWPGHGLRKKLSRDMERGRDLSKGGYRRLLR
jgi:hypothetical protein